MTLQGRTKLKMWLVLVAVFVLGSVTGVARITREGHARALREDAHRAEAD